MAMDVTQKFYVFVQAKGGWERVKNAADGCTNRGTKNGIVEKEELYNWLSVNYTDFEAHDFETIWANIDTVQTGNITKGIENLGALDEKEAGNVSSKADKYRYTISLLESYFRTINTDAWGIDKDDLIYRLATEIGIIPEGGSLPNDMEARIVSTVKDLIKDKLLKNYSNQTANLLACDDEGNQYRYDLSSDEDLNGLITNYLGTINNISDLNDVKDYVDNIIKAYLHTAGIGEDVQGIDNGYRYGNCNYDTLKSSEGLRLNELQKAKLYTACKQELTVAKICSDSKFRDYSSYGSMIQETLDLYIKNHINIETMKQKEFFVLINDGLGNKLRTDFLNSNEATNLLNVLEIMGLGETVNAWLDDEDKPLNNGSTDWSKFYGMKEPYTGDLNDPNWTENDPKRFISMLYYFGGMGGLDDESMKTLVNSPIFKTYIQKGYNDIIKNPDLYGISLNNCKPADMQNALLRYFKDNLETILLEVFGPTQRGKIAYALENNAMQTANLFLKSGEYASVGVQTGAYGKYTEDDVKDDIKEFIDFVGKYYTSEATVMEALDKLKELTTENTNGSYDISTDWDDIYAAMQAVVDAIGKLWEGDEPEAPGDTGFKFNIDSNMTTFKDKYIELHFDSTDLDFNTPDTQDSEKQNLLYHRIYCTCCALSNAPSSLTEAVFEEACRRAGLTRKDWYDEGAQEHNYYYSFTSEADITRVINELNKMTDADI